MPHASTYQNIRFRNNEIRCQKTTMLFNAGSPSTGNAEMNFETHRRIMAAFAAFHAMFSILKVVPHMNMPYKNHCQCQLCTGSTSCWFPSAGFERWQSKQELGNEPSTQVALQHSTFDIPCSTFDIPCSTFDIPCSIFDIPCSIFDIHSSA